MIMIFNKKKLKIFFILFVGMYLTLTCELIVAASETQIIKANEIENSAINHLIKELPWKRESLEINIYYKGKDIILPSGKKELIYKIMNSSQRAGRIPMILEIRIDDQFKKRIRINTKVLVSQKIIKTVREVRRGEILSNDEIKIETIQTERPLRNAITNIDSALGYEATRNISIGKILIPNFIKRPALGNRGDKILIKAQKGGMTITTPGILKEDGYEDAMVKVLNMESKKLIYGRLVDSNTVKVKF
jgi:flagellar basal body P-ring formation protein FlgA